MAQKKDWYEHSFTNWDNRFETSEGLNVLIARKAPRMVEYEKTHGKLHDNNLSTLVSEHALPFIMWDDYPRISVVDDAIYYGTTFENVISWLKTIRYFTDRQPLTKNNLIANPVVRAKGSKVLDNIDLTGVEVISDENIPYYIERLTTSFLELGKPFDIEFPILYFHKPSSFFYYPDEILSILKNIFEVEVYRVNHINAQADSEENTPSDTTTQNKIADFHTNYSIIFSSSLAEGKSNMEFAKFRLFVSKNEICLTSYVPSVFSEDILTEESPLFVGTLFESLWKEAYVPPIKDLIPSAEKSYLDYLLRIYKVEKIDRYQWDYQQEQVELLRQRSLMILANYFCSYAYLLKKKRQIIRLSEQLGCQITGLKLYDLQLLFGPKLASVFITKLNECWEDNQIPLAFTLPEPAVLSPEFLDFLTKDVIPEPYADNYYSENEQDWRRSENLSESLSSMFNNMHFHIEKASRGNQPNTFERLRFGVSYDSMYYNLSRKQKHTIGDNMYLSLHWWMDKKIDEGSIVPKYDKVQYLNKYYWRRLFRAGENEDRYFGQLVRIAIYVFNHISHYLGEEDSIERDFVENIFAVIFSNNFFKDPSLTRLGKISWGEAKPVGMSYRLSFHNDGITEATSLIDYLLRMQILKEIDDYTPHLSLINTPLINEFRNGTTLESETEEKIHSYLKILMPLLHDNTSVEKVIGTMNRIMLSDFGLYNIQLTQWREKTAIPFFDHMINYPETELDNNDLFQKFKDEIATLFLKSYAITSHEIWNIYRDLPERQKALSKRYKMLAEKNIALAERCKELAGIYDELLENKAVSLSEKSKEICFERYTEVVQICDKLPENTQVTFSDNDMDLGTQSYHKLAGQEKNLFLLYAELKERYKELAGKDTGLPENDPLVCFKPDSESNRIYQQTLYTLYNFSELIQAIYSFNDEDYVSFIVNEKMSSIDCKAIKECVPITKDDFKDFQLKYNYYAENKKTFFEKAKEMIYHESVNQGNTTEGH